MTNLTNNTQLNSTQLMAVFNTFSIATQSCYPRPWNRISINTDWINVVIGRDENQDEFVSAATGNGWNEHNFTFNAVPPVKTRLNYLRQRRQWVYSLITHPENYLKCKIRPTELAYGDFKVAYGLDSRRRQFLYVITPRNMIFLFRNPKSRAVLPWSPATAIAVVDGMVNPPDVITKQVEMPAVDPESTGDSELDEILGIFG